MSSWAAGYYVESFHPLEIKSARVSRITGTPISFYHAGRGEAKFTVLDAVASEGAHLNRGIISYSNHIATQEPYRSPI